LEWESNGSGWIPQLSKKRKFNIKISLRRREVFLAYLAFSLFIIIIIYLQHKKKSKQSRKREEAFHHHTGVRKI